jgi:glutaryl-CoA dehydrogenase
MITEITKAQLSLEIRSVVEEGKLQRTDLYAKRNNVEIAINIAREARQMLGGELLVNTALCVTV